MSIPWFCDPALRGAILTWLLLMFIVLMWVAYYRSKIKFLILLIGFIWIQPKLSIMSSVRNNTKHILLT